MAGKTFHSKSIRSDCSRKFAACNKSFVPLLLSIQSRWVNGIAHQTNSASKCTPRPDNRKLSESDERVYCKSEGQPRQGLSFDSSACKPWLPCGWLPISFGSIFRLRDFDTWIHWGWVNCARILEGGSQRLLLDSLCMLSTNFEGEPSGKT